MENMNLSQIDSICPMASGQALPPFAEAIVQISKKDYIQLKRESHYWQRQHERALAREAQFKQELELAQAEIRDLKQRLYGKRSEKSTTSLEAQSNPGQSLRPRGQVPLSKGHGRTPRPHLPLVEELRILPPNSDICPNCYKPYALISKTEDSTIIEINVLAHVRKIKRQCRLKAFDCPNVPTIITAPPAPRLMPKSSLGVSVWVEVLIRKYLHSIPSHRLCTDLTMLGAAIAQGTLTGGLQKLRPLFEPLCEALMERHLTERLFHGDESRWKVFEEVDGKIGYRWYLWLTRSASVVYFWMAPGRGAVLFSVLQTLILWDINPRHWLHVYLTACAENGGQSLTDLTPFLPWTMDEARLGELKQPLADSAC